VERRTRQRDAIKRALEEADRPLGAPEVLEAARSYAPGLGIATVYRTLKALCGDGTLIAVELPGEPPRYEVAGKEHHGHFWCRTCRKVFEVECPISSTRAPAGFCVEGHMVLLHGLCSGCSREAEPAR